MNVFDLQATISLSTDGFEQNLRNAQKKFESFGKNITSVSSDISGMASSVKKAYSNIGDLFTTLLDGFKAVENIGTKAASGVTTALKGFGAAATAVAGFGTAAVKSGMSFDATMSEVSAISGATGQNFQDLRDKALEMGAKTKFSASEAAEAMTYMGMAGWKTQDMLDGIAGIMNLAAASGEDLATTSDIVTDALTAFGLQASDSGRFADILAAAATNANTNVSMMGESFKYAAPIAGSLGYSVEDASIALGLMANSGIKASSAGTALRSIMTRLATNAGHTKTQMGALEILTENLGVAFYNADGTARDLNSVLEDAREAWKGLGDEQAVSYAKIIAGQYAMSGWLSLMNAAPEDVNKLTDAIYDCNGAAEEMAATMADNLQGDLTLLGSAFESLQIAISDSLTPTLRGFAQFGQRAMANLLEGFQGGGITGFTSALTGVVNDGVTMLAGKAPEFADVSLQFIKALADGFLNAADTLVNTGYDVAWQVIGGIGSWISQNSDRLVEVGKDIVWSILNGFLGATDIISENVGKFIPLIVDGFTAYHEALFTAGVEILGAIGKGFSENKEEVQHYISITIENMTRSLKENAPMIIEGGLALLETLVGAIEENLPLIIETGAQIVGQLISGIATASPGVQAIIATAVLPHILKIIETVGSIGAAVGSVVKLVGSGINSVISIGTKLMSGIQALWALMAANPITLVIAAIAALVAAFVLLWNNCEEFRDFWIGLWESSKQAVSVAAEAISGFLSNAWSVVQSAWKSAGKFFSGVWAGIQGAFSGAVEVLGGFFTSAWAAAKGAWDNATSFFGGVWSNIKGVFSDALSTFAGIGSNVVDGIKNGISSAWNALTSWLTDKFKSLVNGVKSVLGIASPSKVFAGIGGNMALGLQDGWEDEYADIRREIENGLSFSAGNIGVTATGTYNTAGTAQSAPQAGFGGAGNTTVVNIYNPEKRDAITEAREWKKTTQRMAMSYV